MKAYKNYKAIGASILLVTSLIPSVVSAQATLSERNSKASKVAALYNMAEQAYKDGDIEVARDTLKIVMAEQPGHAHSIALLRKIKLNGAQFEVAKRQRLFNSVMLREVDLNGVNLAQALKILNQQVITESGKRVIPNITLVDPKKYLGNEEINLELRNIPAGDVLKQLMLLNRCSAKFGKYSIMVKPRPRAKVKKSNTDIE